MRKVFFYWKEERGLCCKNHGALEDRILDFWLIEEGVLLHGFSRDFNGKVLRLQIFSVIL